MVLNCGRIPEVGDENAELTLYGWCWGLRGHHLAGPEIVEDLLSSGPRIQKEAWHCKRGHCQKVLDILALYLLLERCWQKLEAGRKFLLSSSCFAMSYQVFCL